MILREHISSLNMLSDQFSFHCLRAPFVLVAVGSWARGVETLSPGRCCETPSWKQGVGGCTLCLHH